MSREGNADLPARGLEFRLSRAWEAGPWAGDRLSRAKALRADEAQGQTAEKVRLFRCRPEVR
jgi:hypothetical protein